MFTLLQLREALKKFQWNKYDIDAYCTLVESGQCTANDLSIRSNIPSGRIHNILKGLIQRGVVKKKLGRPAIFDAQNPKHVLDLELKELTKLCEEAKETILPLWEARAESQILPLSPSVVESFSGVVNEIRNLIVSSKESLILVVSDLTWIGRQDFDNFNELIKKGVDVKVVGSERSQNELKSIAGSGVITKVTNGMKKNYCISDHSIVVWISEHMENGTIVCDKRLAEVLEFDFGQNYGGIGIMEVDAIAI